MSELKDQIKKFVEESCLSPEEMQRVIENRLSRTGIFYLIDSLIKEYPVLDEDVRKKLEAWEKDPLNSRKVHVAWESLFFYIEDEKIGMTLEHLKRSLKDYYDLLVHIEKYKTHKRSK